MAILLLENKRWLYWACRARAPFDDVVTLSTKSTGVVLSTERERDRELWKAANLKRTETSKQDRILSKGSIYVESC